MSPGTYVEKPAVLEIDVRGPDEGPSDFGTTAVVTVRVT